MQCIPTTPPQHMVSSSTTHATPPPCKQCYEPFRLNAMPYQCRTASMPRCNVAGAIDLLCCKQCREPFRLNAYAVAMPMLLLCLNACINALLHCNIAVLLHCCFNARVCCCIAGYMRCCVTYAQAPINSPYIVSK